MSYSYSTDEESFHGQFETREEAIQEGFAELEGDMYESGDWPRMIIWTGENVTPRRIVAADDYNIENIKQHTEGYA